MPAKSRRVANHKRTIVIDTNLLLLLVIGSVDDGKFIHKSDRLSKFSKKDYELLVDAIGIFGKNYITKYIATEVSNLIDLHSYARDKAYENARVMFKTFNEIHSNLNDDMEHHHFVGFGITDSKLVELALTHIIFTDDRRVAPLLWENGLDNVYSLEMIRALAS
jgi:rRNA-processing protein FCF1